MTRRCHEGTHAPARGTLAFGPRLASDRGVTLSPRAGVVIVALLALAGAHALAQEAVPTEAMAPSPGRATMCRHGCETLARRRAGHARVRVLSARNGDAPADGTTLWLVVETGAGSFARALAEGGVGCGFDRPLASHVELELLALLDVEGSATPEIRVTWRRTVEGAGGREALACGLEHGVPTCAEVAPAAE